MIRARSPGKGARAAQTTTSKTVDLTDPTIVEHPDGYYWSAPGGRGGFGPYETYELAQAARDAVDDEAVAPGDALLEAERGMGIADWLDAETGEPAEGQSPPHLRED